MSRLNKKKLVFYPLNKTEQKRKFAKKNYRKSITYVGLVSKSDRLGNYTISVGRSFCVKEDQFCKKIGRRLAYDKALNVPCFTFKVDTLTGIHNIFNDKCKEHELKLAKLREDNNTLLFVKFIKWIFNIK